MKYTSSTKKKKKKKKKSSGKRLLVSAAAAIVGGVLWGVTVVRSRSRSRSEKVEKNKLLEFVKKMTPFPQKFVDDISRPFWKDRESNDEGCRDGPPMTCATSVDCQKLCGPNHECVFPTKDPPVLYNGVLLNPEVRYCLDVRSKFVGCAAGLSHTVVTYDRATESMSFACLCKYPDIFAGEDCSKQVACADPADVDRTAPIVRRDTGEPVPLDGSVNLHAMDPYTGEPVFGCACKMLGNKYSAGVQGLDCLLDPCFPLAAGRRPPTGARGMSDSHRGVEPDCACGVARTTRLFGRKTADGEKATVCLPIMAGRGHCEYSFVNSEGDVECGCDRNENFLPCDNPWRDRDWGRCSEGNAAFMTRADAPQAGQCMNPCAYCSSPEVIGRSDSDSACTLREFKGRTDAECVAERGESRLKRPSYKCKCRSSGLTSWWETGVANGVCWGKTPPCKKWLGKCDVNHNVHKYGHQCCNQSVCRYGLCGMPTFDWGTGHPFPVPPRSRD